MEITDAKYQELLGDQNKARELEKENSKLKETAENTKTGLKAGRDEIATLKKDKETLQGEFDEFKTTSEAELTKLEWFDDVKSNSDNWLEHQTKINEDRATGIEEMKTKLGEDFMKANESFLDGLPDDKVETFLTWNVEALEWGKKTVTTWTWTSWMKDGWGTTHKTDFDEAISKWDATWAMNAIPAPWSY